MKCFIALLHTCLCTFCLSALIIKLLYFLITAKLRLCWFSGILPHPLDSSLTMASRFHLGLPVGEGTPCFSKPAAIFPKAATGKISSKYPTHHFGFAWIYLQFSVRIDRVSVALAFYHFGAAILKASPETVLDRFTFLDYIHLNSPQQIKIPQ